jgi:hypothetical protein
MGFMTEAYFAKQGKFAPLWPMELWTPFAQW